MSFLTGAENRHRAGLAGLRSGWLEFLRDRFGATITFLITVVFSYVRSLKLPKVSRSLRPFDVRCSQPRPFQCKVFLNNITDRRRQPSAVGKKLLEIFPSSLSRKA